MVPVGPAALDWTELRPGSESALWPDCADSSTQSRSWLTRQLAKLLDRDATRFLGDGLEAIEDTERATLAAEYRAIDHPAAREVADYLEGVYIVGSECLTD